MFQQLKSWARHGDGDADDLRALRAPRDAEIVEQVPDQRIAWRSTTPDAPNAGTVRFEPLGPDSTRVNLTMEYEPQGTIEKAGDAIGAMSGRVEKTVKQFKAFIESRGAESGGWRGEVHGGQKTR